MRCVVVQSVSRVWLFATLGSLQHSRLPCFLLSPRVCWSSYPLSRWCHPIISFSVSPFSSCSQSFSASGSFPLSWLFSSGGQRIGASASVLPVNIQGLFPLRLTSLIFLKPKRISRVFSSTATWKNHSLGLSLHGPTHTSIHDYWENHSFDYTDCCWQSDVSAF